MSRRKYINVSSICVVSFLHLTKMKNQNIYGSRKFPSGGVYLWAGMPQQNMPFTWIRRVPTSSAFGLPTERSSPQSSLCPTHIMSLSDISRYKHGHYKHINLKEKLKILKKKKKKKIHACTHACRARKAKDEALT